VLCEKVALAVPDALSCGEDSAALELAAVANVVGVTPTVVLFPYAYPL
jgi:hypothetical protein